MRRGKGQLWVACGHAQMLLYPQILHIRRLYFLVRPQNMYALSLHGSSSLLKKSFFFWLIYLIVVISYLDFHMYFHQYDLWVWWAISNGHQKFLGRWLALVCHEGKYTYTKKQVCSKIYYILQTVLATFTLKRFFFICRYHTRSHPSARLAILDISSHHVRKNIRTNVYRIMWNMIFWCKM